MAMSSDLVSVRYMVDDVQAAVDFYTEQFGFEQGLIVAPAFAEVTREKLRLLLAGPQSSAGRPMPDGQKPAPGGWNRIHFVVEDIEAEVERLRGAGAQFRNEIVTGPRGRPLEVGLKSHGPAE
jgi:catechol 2,3-dioxygenase-like lactoylglutathione lyase family enzyme